MLMCMFFLLLYYCYYYIEISVFLALDSNNFYVFQLQNSIVRTLNSATLPYTDVVDTLILISSADYLVGLSDCDPVADIPSGS